MRQRPQESNVTSIFYEDSTPCETGVTELTAKLLVKQINKENELNIALYNPFSYLILLALHFDAREDTCQATNTGYKILT